MLGHMVYFTLKDSSPAAVDRLVRSCHELLTGHPGTSFFAAGTLASAYQRSVNVRDFHVALQVVFESHEAHDQYQASARHQQFIEQNNDNWAQVRVFDADVE
jgi:hypothetical protein